MTEVPVSQLDRLDGMLLNILDKIINDQPRETMHALTFWKTIARDQSNLLENLIALLNEHGTRFCVIGWQAVNAYVELLVSLDLGLVVGVGITVFNRVEQTFMDTV